MDTTLASANELLATHKELTSEVRALQRHHRKVISRLASPPQELLSLPLLPSPLPSPPASPTPSEERSTRSSRKKHVRSDLPQSKRAKVARFPNYVPEEETIRNDYSQHYVDTGDWPQNWVLGAEPERRFEEYPKQQKLLALKKAAVIESSIAPIHIPQSELTSLAPTKFDVILIDPPFSSSFSWDTLEALPAPSLAADPSFIFLWVGSGAGEGLERGRAVLAKWGFRRCEDIVWIKTNRLSNNGPGSDPPTTSLLTRTKQHCLMGIRGTVRRSTDSWFVHCNIDTDVIIWEGDPTDPTRKPPEMYTLIENFCLGLRRLEIFGRPYSLRPGWVTAGDFELTSKLTEETGARSWDPSLWESELVKDPLNRALVPMTHEIEILRPKSPHRSGGPPQANVPQFSMQAQAPHVLPARPPTMNRNPNGAFSGNVGLGVPRPQPSMVPMMQTADVMMPQMGMPTGPHFMGGAPTMMGGMPMQMMGMPMNMNMGMPFQPGMFNPNTAPGGMGGMMPAGSDMSMGMSGMQPGPGMMFNADPNQMMGGMNMNMMNMGGSMNMGGPAPPWNGGMNGSWNGMQ